MMDSDFSTELQNILDEQFNPDRPNAVWCSDITYIWTIDGFVYLTSIMDLFSRKIIAWTLSETLEVSCVIDTINNSGINAFMQSKTFLITVLHYILRLRKALHKQSPSNIFFRGLTSSQIVVNVKPL